MTEQKTTEQDDTKDERPPGALAMEHSESGLSEEDSSHPLLAGAPVRPDSPTFADLGVRPEVVTALRATGIERTFAIQELSLPLALAGDDVIGQARTGTGKTLGFGVPLLQRLTVPGDGTPQSLVVVPTRELCLQVARDIADASTQLGARISAVYGGRPYEPQIEALTSGVDVVVGTPGRLIDLAERRHLVLGKVSSLVLDEADEMLDLGFLPDIERILKMVPESRQTMLFSATMPGPILTLARTFLQAPTHIRAEDVDAAAIHERTSQFVYRAHPLDKEEVIARVLQATGRGRTMIFVRTKRTAQKLSDALADRGFATAAVHGDLNQEQRERSLRTFRSAEADVLVATDVAARGMDIADVTHVINHQCPDDEKTYVHRIGRTGRVGKKGAAVTLVDWEEEPRWKLISDALELDMPEPVETYSTSAHLYSDLEIPTSAGGYLGSRRAKRARDRGSSGEPRPQRDRKPRRRTRAGRPVERNDAGRPVDPEPSPAPGEDTASSGGPSAQPGRRRRRRRGSRGRGSRAGGSQPSSDTPTG
jgi:superfamily II DNA/RNA helicase